MTENDAPIFDTHAHLISDDFAAYPKAEAYRDSTVPPYPVRQLLGDMAATNVPRACAVQRYHFYITDNSYTLDASLQSPDRLTPVVMLNGPEVSAPLRLKEYARHQRLGGLRLACPALTQWDTGWMNAPQTMKLWETAAEMKLPVAIIFFEWHLSYTLPALKLIASTFPEMPIIVDHLGTRHGAVPDIKKLRAEGKGPYIKAPDYGVTPALRELIPHSNVHFKFTGINLEMLADDKIDAAVFLKAFTDEFGAERIVSGSDIGQTKGPYARIVSELRAATRLLNARERDLVLYGNADRLYGQTLRSV